MKNFLAVGVLAMILLFCGFVIYCGHFWPGFVLGALLVCSVRVKA